MSRRGARKRNAKTKRPELVSPPREEPPTGVSDGAASPRSSGPGGELARRVSTAPVARAGSLVLARSTSASSVSAGGVTSVVLIPPTLLRSSGPSAGADPVVEDDGDGSNSYERCALDREGLELDEVKTALRHLPGVMVFAEPGSDDLSPLHPPHRADGRGVPGATAVGWPG